MSEHFPQVVAGPTNAFYVVLCNRQREEDRRAGDDNVSEPLLSLAELLLQLSAFGDIEKCDYGADHVTLAANRIRPVLGWEAGPIRAPENLVIDMTAQVLQKRQKYFALLHRI